jgi:glycosyltransferase involved in cell wall biosynthesis
VVVNGGNCRFADVNWVHYVHAAYQPELCGTGVRRLKRRVERELDLRAERAATRVARLVVCNSERTRRDVIERLGVRPERTTVVYYGNDSARYHPPTESDRADLRLQLGLVPEVPIFVFVGALGDRRKGFDTLFEAWRLLISSGSWDAMLLVVGSGTELPKWERLSRDAGLNRTVRFLGFRKDVPDLLRAADVLVSPTRYEAYGLGVQEALCCGLPALVTGDAGVAERYPAELADLLLPDPDDAGDLACRLRRVRDELPGTRARVRALSNRLRIHSWDDMARELVAAAGE